MSEAEKYVIVPYSKMDELLEKVERISEVLLKGGQQNKSGLGDFISEKDAQQLMSRRSTWFWNQRKSGKLKGKKAGGQWFYKRSEILAYIEKGSP